MSGASRLSPAPAVRHPLDGSPQFRMGPLTIPVGAAVLQAWANDAGGSAAIIYAYGPDALPDDATFVLARALAEAGRVSLVRARRSQAGVWDFIAQRSQQADPGGGVPEAAARDVLPAGVASALALLTEAADAGAVCPTNREIAATLDLASAEAARWLVRQLVALGLIRIEGRGPNVRRIVTIAATGRCTVPGRL